MLNSVLAILGLIAIVYGHLLGLILIAFAVTGVLLLKGKISSDQAKKFLEDEGKKPPSLEIFLDLMGITEEEFNKVAKSMSVPPYEHKFGSNKKLAKKTKDFDDWYREKN